MSFDDAFDPEWGQPEVGWLARLLGLLAGLALIAVGVLHIVGVTGSAVWTLGVLAALVILASLLA